MNIEQKIEELEKQLNSLKEEVKSCNVKYWKPEKGENFYYVECTRIYVAEYDNSDFTKELVLTGNFFQTKDEAKKELKLRLATQRLKEAIWEANGGKFIGFEVGAINYTIFYSAYTLEVQWFTRFRTTQNWMYIKDQKTAIKVLEENRKDFEIYYGLNK